MRNKNCILAIVLALGLSACASTAINSNLDETQRVAESKIKQSPRWLQSDEDRPSARREVDDLLTKPLNMAAAQAITLRHSPAFQIMLAEAAAASARSNQSARMPNPVFVFERAVRSENGISEVEIGRMLAISLFDLLTLPSRMDRDKSQQERLRMKMAGDVLQANSDAAQAWVNAVSAAQALRYQNQIMESAAAGAELAKRMQKVGNFSRLQYAREQSFYNEYAAQLVRAKQAATDARERLVQVLGLDAKQAAQLKLPSELPALPTTPIDEKTALQTAFDDRLDVRMARFDLQASATSLGLTNVQSVVNGLHIAGSTNSETGLSTKRGYEIEFPIPIFDFGDAKRAEAQAQYMAVFNRAAQVGIEASSQLRQSYSSYRSAYDLARHYRDDVVPLRKLIADEMMLKYNGMLIGVFELLSDSRDQANSVIAAIGAQRDFWMADVALQSSLLGKPAGGPRMEASAASAGEGGGH